jgi:poly-beta-1,6 N-acetyl-D-glucosamine synthase
MSKLYYRISKSPIVLDYGENANGRNNFKKKYFRRIIVSGLISVLLILLIIYTLPYTILNVSSLIEYSIVVALALFLLILLVRYFGVLFFSYFYLNEYTFNDTNDFTPFVSIIVPAFNEEKIIENSINSLLNLNYGNYEIIIVNDGSTDNTKAVVEKLVGYKKGKAGVVKISLIDKPNGGKSTALNAGIEYAKGEFILCMDGDSQLSSNSLKLAVRHFKNPKIGAVAGNVKVMNRNKFYTDLQALEYVEGLNMVRSAQSYVRLVNIIPGPIGIFRKTALKEVQNYSNDTFAEDADLTLKLLAKGWKIYYEPEAVSYTEAPSTLQELLKQRYRWTRGIIQSIRKHKNLLVNPTINFGDTLILWVMLYEALIWPVMNIMAHLFFIVAALVFGLQSLIFFWWAGLALLDIAAAIYCVAAEREELRLVWYAIFYRMFFILVIDVCKLMSTIEEFIGIKMTWGKLRREGTVKV